MKTHPDLANPRHTATTRMLKLIGAITTAHLVLYFTVLVLVRDAGIGPLGPLFLCLSIPVFMPVLIFWQPANALEFYLAALLNSSLWGVTLGVLFFVLGRRRR